MPVVGNQTQTFTVEVTQPRVTVNVLQNPMSVQAASNNVEVQAVRPASAVTVQSRSRSVKVDYSPARAIMAFPGHTHEFNTSHDHDGQYEPDGAVAAHEALADPHPSYLTPAEADLAYEALGAVAEHTGFTDAHHTRYTDQEAIDAQTGLWDPAGSAQAAKDHADAQDVLHQQAAEDYADLQDNAHSSADRDYGDQQDDLHSTDDRAYADTQDDAHSTADRGYTDTETVKRMRWMGEHTTEGFAYSTNDVTRDGDWTMVAITDTTDRPAPTPEGSPTYLYEGTSPTGQVTAKQITYGQQFHNPTGPYYLTGWRAYVVAGNHYSAWTILDPEGEAVLEPLLEWDAGQTGWTEFSLSSGIVPIGTTFQLVVTVREPDPTPTTITGNWDYDTPQNSGAPPAGVVLHANTNQALMQISKTDADAGDRGAELLALTAGDTIDALGSSWVIQSITDQGTYIDFGVAPASQASPDGLTQFTFTTETTTPITLVMDPDYWLESPVAGADIVGVYSIDGAPTVVTDDAYGVDLQYQAVNVSPDWEVLALSGRSGGGGGGSGGEPHDHDTAYVNVTGDVMQGNLDFATYGITNVWELTLDTLTHRVGGDINLGSSINAAGNTIYGVPTPTADDWVVPKSHLDAGLAGKSDISHTHSTRPWYEAVISGAVSIKAATYVDMPGTLITFDLAEQSTIEVTGQFDFRFTQGTLGSRVLIGVAAVDGVEQSQVQALLQLDGGFGRVTVPLPKRRYVLAAGTHTVVLRARSSNTTGTAGIIEVSGHTNLIVEVI